MRISQTGLDLIKRYEGLRLRAYKDSAGVWTIGYGHTRGVRRGMAINEAQATAFLKEDLHEAESAVQRHTSIKLTQSQFDALVSFVFNVGGGAFRKSTLLKRVNAKRFAECPEQFCRWTMAGGKRLLGLARRRVAEAALFVS